MNAQTRANVVSAFFICFIVACVMGLLYWGYGPGHEQRHADYVAAAKAEAQQNLKEIRERAQRSAN